MAVRRAPAERSSLASRLEELEPEALARVMAQRWKGPRPPASLPELADALARSGSMEAVFSLDLGARQVLDALALLLGDAARAGARAAPAVSVTDVAALLGVDAGHPDLFRALVRLEEAGMVVAAGEELVGLGLAEGIPRPAALGPPVARLHSGTTSGGLRQMLERLGAPIRSSGAAKPELLRTLAGALGDPDLARLLERGPRGTLELASRAAGAPQLAVSVQHPRAPDDTPLGWLVNRGLLVNVDWLHVVMPREAALSLRGGRLFSDLALEVPALDLVPGPTAGPESGGAAVRGQRAPGSLPDALEAARQVVSAVETVVSRLGESPAAQLKSGGLGTRELRRLAKALDGDEKHAGFLVELAEVSGLLTGLSGGVVTASAEASAWLEEDLAGRWAALARGWYGSDIHLGLAGATGTDGKPIPALAARPYPQVTRCRELVLSALAGVPPGRAPSPESLVRLVSWQAPGLWRGGPAPPATLVDWMVHEAVSLGLAHPAHAGATAASELGRALVADGVDAAVSALAAHLPAPARSFLVQPDLSAVAAGPLELALTKEMEVLADVESSGAATVFRFSEASLRRAFDQGRTAETILGFLEAHAERGVPQALAYLIGDVGRRHGQLRSGSACSYLRAEDAALLAEVLANRRLGGLGLRLLAPTVAVSDQEPASIIEALRAAGYLPAAESPGGDLVLEQRQPRPPGRRLRAHAFEEPRAGAGADDPVWVEAARALLSGRPSSPVRGAPLRSAPSVRRAISPEEVSLDGWERRFGAASAQIAPVAGLSPLEDRAYHHFGEDIEEEIDIDLDMDMDMDIDEDVDLVEALAALLGLDPDAARGPSRPGAARMEPPRPTHIARDAETIEELIGLAEENEWLVRISYTNGKGRASQMLGTGTISGRRLLFFAYPSFHAKELAMQRVEWARVLTEAEEDNL